MTTVCIIGAGDIGGAIAHALARGERVSRVLLIDADGKVAAGKALDIQQSGAVDRFHVRLDGTDDVTRVAGCAVCVVADRFGRPSSEWQGEEGLAMLTRLAAYAGDAPIVFAGASQAELLRALAREGHVRRERLVGSVPGGAHCRGARDGRDGSELFAVRGRSHRARHAAVGVRRAVERGVDWRIQPRARAVAGPADADRSSSGAAVAAGPFALGLAAARVAEALVRHSRRAFSVLTVLGGEFGVRGRVGAMPVHLSPSGIAQHAGPDAEHPRARPARNRARGVIGSITCEMRSRRWGSSSSASRSLGGDKEIEPDALLGHIKFLAADDLKGRGNGTEGLERAADYIAEQFKAAGLQPGVAGGWFQPFELNAGLIVGPDNKLSIEYRGRTISSRARHELLPARGHGQRHGHRR